MVFVFILYGRTIKHGYAIDDNLVTENQEVVKNGIKAIPQIFTSYYFIDKKMQFGYRPVTLVSFALEHQFFGQNPHISHLINILLYVINCFLVYIIIRKLFNASELFSLLVSVLFVAHPIHTEVVCSIKSRDELLGFFFSFYALWLCFVYADKPKFYILPVVMLLLVMAIFSKQTAYSFLAVIPLSLYYYKKRFVKKEQILVISFLVLAVVIASLPRFILPPVSREIFYFENPLSADGSFINRISTALYVIAFYIKILIIPHPLVFYYGFNMLPIPTLLNPVVLISLIFCLGIIIFALINHLKYPVLSYSIFFFFITISMFLNIVEPVAGIVGERFVFFASISYCMLIALIIFKIFKINISKGNLSKSAIYKLSIISFIIIIPYSVKTYIRAGQWENYSTLYANDIKYLDNSALANAVYAEILINEIYKDISQNRQPKDFEKKINLSLKHYKKSIEIYPDYFSSYNNVAFIYYQFFQDYNKAIPYLQKAIELRSDYTEAHFNLAYCYQMLGRLSDAEEVYFDAIATDSTFVQAYSKLGEVYLQMKKLPEAVEMNKKIMQLLPGNDLPYINLGKIFLSVGDTVQSMQNFEKAAELSPDNVDLIQNLINFYEFRGHTEKANYYKNILSQYR